MKKQFQGAIIVLAAVVAVTTSSAALAQSAGVWSLKAGVNQITPKVKSDDMSASALPGTKVDVKSDTQAIFAASYMFTDNFSADLHLDVPFSCRIYMPPGIAGLFKCDSFGPDETGTL